MRLLQELLRNGIDSGRIEIHAPVPPARRGRVQSSFSSLMHGKFVAPQKRWAHVVLPGTFTARQVGKIAAQVHSLLGISPDMGSPGEVFQ
ncbi:MAG TPA: hypothetical protein VFD66_12750 [Verrucomicrobiae bacterium]|nr:hypothetical protein [Verrucomicrobiae bacterium]